jgi:DNA-binding MarR family transcriptional regulator
MVDRLVQLGFVNRSVDEENRRQVTIFTTQKGEAVILELQRGIVENYRALLEKLPEEDQERLVQAFETLADVLGTLE